MEVVTKSSTVVGRTMDVVRRPARVCQLEAVVVSHDHAPDECTVSPREVDEARQTTAWITAREGSYCDAEAMR
ncbi:DUF7511 domain-containing protein [Halococcoides cellulosivorans]|uniref:DUF7511 domain-containing protein n=1 Tax=Halococcoides cellulosivorans TaxID=1679096 RepID=UPI00131ED591|nr:hypothetical protein [Halococcoides cellulosivorans]